VALVISLIGLTLAWIGIVSRYSIALDVSDNQDDKLEDMDAELARARGGKKRRQQGHDDGHDEDDGVDIYKHRRRYRWFKAILLGAALAGLTSLILAMIDGGKNPCERVRNYVCAKDPAGLQCKSYEGIVDESAHDSSPEMRSQIRAQCEAKIARIKEDEGVVVK
jgi:hypothetical protein